MKGVERLKVTQEVYQAMEMIQQDRYMKKILVLPDSLSKFEKERRIQEYKRQMAYIMDEFQVG
jgi:CBS domain containing-hemolysin-like protein